jgi:hypothetical protein
LLSESPDERGRRELIDFIRRNDSRITVNELRQRNRRFRNKSEAEVSAALKDLVRNGHATRVPATSGKKGGRPADRYTLVD